MEKVGIKGVLRTCGKGRYKGVLSEEQVEKGGGGILAFPVGMD